MRASLLSRTSSSSHLQVSACLPELISPSFLASLAHIKKPSLSIPCCSSFSMLRYFDKRGSPLSPSCLDLIVLVVSQIFFLCLVSLLRRKLRVSRFFTLDVSILTHFCLFVCVALVLVVCSTLLQINCMSYMKL